MPFMRAKPKTDLAAFFAAAEFSNGLFAGRLVLAMCKILKKPKNLREMARELNMDVAVVEVIIAAGLGTMATTVAANLKVNADDAAHQS